jgi:hypothetical protein
LSNQRTDLEETAEDDTSGSETFAQTQEKAGENPLTLPAAPATPH